MSYRTTVNGVQIFGNNEYYPEWIDFVKEQGIDEEDGEYDGEIMDIMGAVKTIEDIVLRLEREHREDGIGHDYDSHYIVATNETMKNKRYRSLFDFSGIYDKTLSEKGRTYRQSLTDRLLEIQENAYVFMPLAFLKACGNCIKRKMSRNEDRTWEYVLVKGKSVHVHAG